MRLVPECASELLGADDCAFAVAVASVAFGAEISPMANPRPQPPPHNPLPPLDLDKWCGERLVRKDREMFAAKVLSFVQVGAATRRRAPAFRNGELRWWGLRNQDSSCELRSCQVVFVARVLSAKREKG